jgi:hypothetical protein
MSLLVVEILLAIVALRRGWRFAPLLLVALSGAAFAYQLAGVAGAVAHGLSLVGLLIASWAGPSERPTSAGALGRPALRRTGPLYQI